MNARREPDTKKNFIDLRARAASARASRRAVIHVRHARRATRLRMNARLMVRWKQSGERAAEPW